MGFIKSAKMQGGKYIAETLRADAKKGLFRMGSADFGDKSVTVNILSFNRLGNVILFPFEPEKATSPLKGKSTSVIFLKKSDKIFSMLVKTYSVGAFENLSAEVDSFNDKNNTKYDISDFEITMRFKKNPKKTDYFVIDFLWGNVDGKPSRLYNDGEIIEGFVPNLLSKEVLAENEEISKNLAFPSEICKEFVRWNMDNGENVLQSEQADLWVLAAGVQLGFVSKEEAKTLAEKTETDILFLSESTEQTA